MASVADQFFADPADWVDFDQFLDIPAGDEYSATATSASPEMALPFETDMLGGDMPEFMQPAFSDYMPHDVQQNGFLVDQSPNMGLMSETTPAFDDAIFDGYQPFDDSFHFRQMVEAQVAADQSVASIKEKRREASIALHLQRLCDATALDLDMSSDSNTSFSSPSWTEYMRESISPQPASSSPGNTPAPPPASGNGGVELVLDLNMNTTTNLPKKQKPRSQAQKENYIKARKYGACEKHKKQHKRCNCLEKAAARAGANELSMDAAFKERPRQPSILVPVLPESRSSTIPGHDPLRISSSMPRPSANLIKKVTSSSPGHDPSLYPPSFQQPIRVTSKTANSCAGHDPQHSSPGVLSLSKGSAKSNVNSPGHDPQYNRFSVRPVVENTGKRTSSIPGHDSSICAPTRPQTSHGSIRVATPQPTLRWQAQSTAGERAQQPFPTDTNCPRTSYSATRYRDTGTLQKPILQVRRPRTARPSSLAEHRSPSTMATPNERDWSPGLPAVPETHRLRLETIHSSRQTLEVLSTCTESSPRERPSASAGKASSGAVGLRHHIACCFTANIGAVFSDALSAIVSACQSSLALSSWTENVMVKCLSFTGRHLMSTKKGLQLFQRQSFWYV